MHPFLHLGLALVSNVCLWPFLVTLNIGHLAFLVTLWLFWIQRSLYIIVLLVHTPGRAIFSIVFEPYGIAVKASSPLPPLRKTRRDPLRDWSLAVGEAGSAGLTFWDGSVGFLLFTR